VPVCRGEGELTGGAALTLEAKTPVLRARPVEPRGLDDVARPLASGRIERDGATTGSVCDTILTEATGAAERSVSGTRSGTGRHTVDRLPP